jgi:hypothetical protein
MITPMEVISDAVKIGLGAVISGVVTFVVLWANHKKERTQRKRELLEDVSKHFARVDRAGLKYWQNMSAPPPPIRPPTSSPAISPGTASEAFTKLNYVIEEDPSDDSTSVQATLWLLGEDKCCALFKEYEDIIWEYPSQALNTNKEFQEAREPLRKKRKAFTDELSDIYRKL